MVALFVDFGDFDGAGMGLGQWWIFVMGFMGLMAGWRRIYFYVILTLFFCDVEEAVLMILVEKKCRKFQAEILNVFVDFFINIFY